MTPDIRDLLTALLLHVACWICWLLLVMGMPAAVGTGRCG